MKNVTYLEELLLGSVQFSLQKRTFTITIEKHVDYQDEFLLGRSTLPTMTRLSIMRLAPVWCIFLFATFFFKPRITLFTTPPP